MLPDPLRFVRPLSSTTINPTQGLGEFAEVQFPITQFQNGRCVRKLPISLETATYDKVVMTTSQSVSTENKPYQTQRTLIRFDAIGNDSTGNPLVASAYCVLSLPESGITNAAADHAALVRILTGFLTSDIVVDSEIGECVRTKGISDNLARLMNGEP